MRTIHVKVCLESGDKTIEFQIGGNLTAEDIRNEVRSTYDLNGGILEQNGLALLGNTVLQAGTYNFVESVSNRMLPVAPIGKQIYFSF